MTKEVGWIELPLPSNNSSSNYEFSLKFDPAHANTTFAECFINGFSKQYNDYENSRDEKLWSILFFVSCGVVSFLILGAILLYCNIRKSDKKTKKALLKLQAHHQMKRRLLLVKSQLDLTW